MNVLVISAHPDPTSYGRSVLNAATDGLLQGGHAVDLIDLYSEGFEPAMTADERVAYETEFPISDPVVKRHAELVTRADALVFVYPTWWWGMPAIMKGWLERVMVKGVAFDLDSRTNRLRPSLDNVKRLVGITTHGGSRRAARFYNDAGRRTVTRGLRLLAPRFRCRTVWLAAYDVDRPGHDATTQRGKFLETVRDRMAKL